MPSTLEENILPHQHMAVHGEYTVVAAEVLAYSYFLTDDMYLLAITKVRTFLYIDQ
jgi:hypothetical protein